MAQPPTYTRQYDFTNFQTSNPSTPLPANQVDIEYNAVKQTLDAINTNLALIQRDDGALANNSVGADQLSSEISLGLRSVADWATGTVYVVNDGVWQDGVLYRCDVAHTSTVFATDLAAEYWSVLVDLASEVDSEVASVVAATVDGAASAAATAAMTAVGVPPVPGSNTGQYLLTSGAGNEYLFSGLTLPDSGDTVSGDAGGPLCLNGAKTGFEIASASGFANYMAILSKFAI